ncbi:hypothetical protein [Roseovarius tolerans]|nr:hypothetical protein [Roseovarius tolerans]
MSYQLGQSNTALSTLKTAVDENTTAIEDLQEHLDGRFDLVESRIELDQSDLKSILMATGTVSEDDAFHAAVIRKDIWVFPSEPVRAEFIDRGMKPEAATDFLSGFRVLPAEVME